MCRDVPVAAFVSFHAASDVFRHGASYLEGHSSLHFLSQHVCDALVEVLEDAHGELRLDAAGGDEVVESVGKGETDPGYC